MLRFGILLFAGLFAVQAFAQKGGTIRGFVTDSETGEAILYTYVVVYDSVRDETFADQTDEKGFFQITYITPGDYVIRVSNAEFDQFSKPVKVTEGMLETVDISLTKGAEIFKEFEVVGNKDKTTDVGFVTPATKRDIEAVPMVGGTKDIVNYLTAAVPGAITTGDQGGQVYIRGGSPIQNKVLLDGMIIYNPFHSIGFFSVFDTDIIRSADIYTGGYNAEYGGRISSVMDIQTRDGDKNNFGGKVDVNPFSSKLLLEGPVWNNRDKGGSSASYVISGKTSYLEQTSKVFYPYVNKLEDSSGNRIKDTIGLPFNFTDIYAKFAVNGASGSKFNVFGFSFNDRVQYRAISDLKWNSYGVGTNFVLVPTGSPVLVEGAFSFSNYRIGLKEEELAERFSEISAFNVDFDFTYFIRKNEVKYGIQVQGVNTDFSTFNELNRSITQKNSTTQAAMYVRYKIISKSLRWVIDPSFRLQYYASEKEFSPEPRLAMKFNATTDLRFKMASGLYSQNLIQANSDRDVVNLFYGFLTGPDNLQKEFVNEKGETVDVNHNLQKAAHLILGVEYDVSKKITVNVEGYVKRFTQLTNMNRNKIFEEDDFDKPDILKKDFIIETGTARGIDFLIKYNTEKMYLWAVYSLSKVDRWDGFAEYAPVFDRRHNVNLVGTIKLSKDNSWEINGRWNFGSGFPFTKTAGFYQSLDFDEGITTDYVTSNTDQLSIQYGALNQGRLPTYHRFDLTVAKTFKFYEKKEDGTLNKNKLKSEIMINAGVTNLYNRSNVFYVNRVTGEIVRQLPILPSVGFSYSF